MKTKLPDVWKEVTLAEVSLDKGQYGSGASAVDYNQNKPRYIRITDIDDNGVLKSDGGKSPSITEEKYFLDEGDFLFARSGSVGRTYLHDNKKGIYQYAGYLIRFKLNKKKILPKYLFYVTKSKYYWGWIEKQRKSVTISNINARQYAKFKFILPPIQTQQKIVAILEKAEKLREWRKEADALTDEFLKSVFLEMFGDPVKNPNEWSKEVLNTNVEKICVSYVGPCNKYYTSKENGVPMIRTGNIKENYLNLDNLKYVTKEFHEKQKKSQLKERDLLIARHGTNGQASLVTKELGVANSLNVVIVRPNKEKYNSIFFTHCFNTNSNLSSLGNKLGGSTQNVINTRAIQNHELIRPPIELQQKFASIVEKVEEMRDAQKQSKAHIGDLFNALMQKAFKGELI